MKFAIYRASKLVVQTDDPFFASTCAKALSTGNDQTWVITEDGKAKASYIRGTPSFVVVDPSKPRERYRNPFRERG